jgi:hypothetical protein
MGLSLFFVDGVFTRDGVNGQIDHFHIYNKAETRESVM